MVDQRRFDNQPGGTTTLSAAEAASFLGVQRRTLYAYVARGQLRSVPGRGNARRYLREDLERLRARQLARSGHGPVAAGALRWGEPVLDSAITAVAPGGIRYRGVALGELVAAGVRYEAVAELLWGGDLDVAPPPWPRQGLPRSLARLARPGAGPLAHLALAVSAMAVADVDRGADEGPAALARARGLVPRLAAALSLAWDPARVPAALAAPSVAEICARALGARRGAAGVRAIDRALVLAADHELNASAFAARVAASTGADLYACVGAALAVVSGPRHGAAPDRVEALVAEAGAPARAAKVVRERLRRGEDVPGFGHPLYPSPAGDPRTAPLLDAARELAPRDRRVQTVLAVVDTMAEAGREAPTLDYGLVAVACALGLPPGAASGLFAVGRSAGWIAHALEQRAAGFMLRPRARYVGP
jgi:citrate synthase